MHEHASQRALLICDVVLVGVGVYTRREGVAPSALRPALRPALCCSAASSLCVRGVLRLRLRGLRPRVVVFGLVVVVVFVRSRLPSVSWLLLMCVVCC